MEPNELHQLTARKLLDARISLEIDEHDLKLLAKSGPAVFVCNHLFPGTDEWIVVHLLSKAFPNVKLLHPYPTSPPRGLKDIALRSHDNVLGSNPFQVSIVRKIARQVKKGNAVALVLDFSDNPLANFGKNLLRVQILEQLRNARQPIVPIHLIAKRHPLNILRRALPVLPLPPNAEPLRIGVRVGQTIPPEHMERFPKNRLWGKFLQAKIFSLGANLDLQPEHFTGEKATDQQDIAPPADPALIAKEMASIEPCKITQRGQFDVFVTPIHLIPNVMQEIARLREITFRMVGEGTGKARDMDEYDLYYLQLIIWDREEKKIAGGYRLGQGDVIFKRFGIDGFYATSLFKIEPGFYPIMQQAVELGRSYIVPEYQKHRLPLFLLWKGILHFLLDHPEYRYLYGPVSISKYYSKVSKAVMVEFIKRFYFDKEMAQFVKPRKPFRVRSKGIDTELLAENLKGEFDALENMVEDIEPEHFKIPVLFRQYLRQNAKFVAFNVDPNFSDCLDGLMVLDIQHLPESTIEALKQEKP